MAIAPVPSISFERVRALSSGDVAQGGRIVEAKVTAMLTDTLARLSIDGRPIDVITPKPLPVGATMTLKAERDGGQLRLVTQGPIRPPVEGVAPPDMPDTLIEPLKALLAQVQAMAVEAELDGHPLAERPAAQSSAAALAALADEASASQRDAGQAANQHTARDAALTQAPWANGPLDGADGADGVGQHPQTGMAALAVPEGAGDEGRATSARMPASSQVPAPLSPGGSPGGTLGQATPSNPAATSQGIAGEALPGQSTEGSRAATSHGAAGEAPPGQSQAGGSATTNQGAPSEALPSRSTAGGRAAMPQGAAGETPPGQSQAGGPAATSGGGMAGEVFPGQRADVGTHFPQAAAARLEASALAAALSERAGSPRTQAVRLPAAMLETLADADAAEIMARDDGQTVRPQAEAQSRVAGAAHTNTDPPSPGALAAKIAAAAHEARQAAASGAPQPDSALPRTASASDGAATPARTDQAAAHITFELPALFPGNPQPLRLEITRDDEPEAEQDGARPPRSWTIRFAAEAGPLGMIHAAISQTDGQIGVRLWAERGETAALFRGRAGQLQASLEASNLKLDALKITQGKPSNDAAGASGGVL